MRIFSGIQAVTNCPLPPIPLPTPIMSPAAKKAVVIRHKTPGRGSIYRQWATIVVAEKDTNVSHSVFDVKYTGPRSRFGRYLRDLEKQGVDITDLIKKTTKHALPTPDTIEYKLAERLYSKLGKNGTKWEPKNGDNYYFRLVRKLLEDNDIEAVVRIVNTIAGYV